MQIHKFFNKGIALLIIMLLVFSHTALGQDIQQHTKLWSAVNVAGPVTCDQKIQYYFEPQLRLIDRGNRFDQGLANIGLGYQYLPNLAFWLGNTWVTTNDPVEGPDHEDRIWQQVSWQIVKNNPYTLASQTRLEQRKDLEEPEWAYRFRQKLTLNIPMKCWARYSYVISDEIFFNLNHPSWIPGQFVDQNRFFIGISIPTAKKASLDVGYLNQYLVRNPDQLCNVIYLGLKIRTG